MIIFYSILSFVSCISSSEEFLQKNKLKAQICSVHEENTTTPESPLYQLLYDSHPQPTQEQQRVRIFMATNFELTTSQIRRLEVSTSGCCFKTKEY